MTEGNRESSLTTVMLWDGYAPRAFNGVYYGMKSTSFEPYLDLPTRTAEQLELAVGGATAPRENLRHYGWKLRNPLDVTKDPQTYQDYIVASKGEFTVAKHGFVITNSGWFSERTAAYLASGRPVVIQDTGFGAWLAVNEGVLPFNSPDGAVRALEALNANYESRCRTARDVAAEYFSHDRVLSVLLESIVQ